MRLNVILTTKYEDAPSYYNAPNIAYSIYTRLTVMRLDGARLSCVRLNTIPPHYLGWSGSWSKQKFVEVGQLLTNWSIIVNEMPYVISSTITKWSTIHRFKCVPGVRFALARLGAEIFAFKV